MKLRGRFCGVALAGLLGWAAACGGDSTGPSASTVTGVAGDSQSAPTGTPLSFPLSFIALNSSGQPAQGVRVTWSVSPPGAATFSPATSTTDASGSASTLVTTGSFVGAITMTATVTGVASVVYHATVVSPCLYFPSYALGDTVHGSLRSTDCNRSNFGFFYDFLALTLP